MVPSRGGYKRSPPPLAFQHSTHADQRVIEAWDAIERSEAAVTGAQAAASRTQEALYAAESELVEAQSALAATRPSHDRAVRAAWEAVSTEVGCR